MTTATKKRKAKAYSVPAGVLRAALRTVSPAIGRQGIHAHVHLGNACEATNGEMRITVTAGWFDDPVLVPFDRLHQIVGSLSSEEDVGLSVDGSLLVVEGARGVWRLPTADAAEWPARVEATEKPLLRLPGDQFSRCVGGVIDATDDESSRYALGGVLVEHKGPGVAFVATDGRRLHVALAEIDQDTDNAAVIVPERAMATISRVAAAHHDEPVQLELAGTELVASVGDTRVFVRLLEGRFPRWQDVIPEPIRPRFGVDDDETYSEAPAHAEVFAGDFLAAVRQASIVTSEQSKGVAFRFGDDLTLTAKSSEHGESLVRCDLTVSGPATEVKLDPVFVTQWLRPLDTQSVVEVFATDAQSAVVLRHDDQLCVVMPLAVD